MQSNSDFTRSGPRRLGDRYQDLIAMEMLIEWLENPERFDAIEIEADEMGSLDDVVGYLTNGDAIVQQVKYTTDLDENEFTWEYLIDQERGRRGLKQSLLQKWSKSFFDISNARKIASASVLSNRRPSEEFSSSLFESKIDLDFLKNSTFYSQIIAQIGDEEQTEVFLNAFEFRLSQPSLEGIENGLQNRFYRLGGSNEGWLNLLSQIPMWASKKGTIALETLRHAALWHRLQAMYQEFEIPGDYVIPSQQFHDDLKKTIFDNNAVTVLTGSPGMGKSTYISYLYKELRNQNIPVIRHHYYLSTHDRDFAQRIEHQKAAESIMHDLQKDHPDSILEARKNNPSASDLKSWIRESGEYFAQQGKSLIVIIDGLDHVWREKRSIENLSELFNQLLPVPKGISLLVATQPVEDNKLPNSLLRASPRSEWKALEALDERAIEAWTVLQLENWPQKAINSEHYIKLLAEKLAEKSQGHPLYLRYAIRYLVEQNKSLILDNIEALPGCPHKDISEYYGQLWTSLSTESKILLELIVSSPFPWPKQELINCLAPSLDALAQHQRSLSEINHLLSIGDLGVQPFHSSLAVYVSSLPDFEDIAVKLRATVFQWLNDNAPEYWKWAYSWIIEADLGNDNAVCYGTNRTWLVEAITRRRLRGDIDCILQRSFKSLLYKDIPAAIKIGVLKDYSYTAHEFIGEVRELLLMPQLMLETQVDPYFQARLFSTLHNLTPTEIATLAEFSFGLEQQQYVNRSVQELEERFDKQIKRIDYHDQNDELLSALLKAMALSDKIEPESVVDWAIKNRGNQYGVFILHHYSRNLRVFHKIAPIRNLVDAGFRSLTTGEIDVILKQAYLISLEDGVELGQTTLANSKSNIFAHIYSSFRNSPKEDFTKIQLPEASLFSLSWSEQHARKQELDTAISSVFFGFLANCLSSADNENLGWLTTIDNYTWQGRFIHILHNMANDIVILRSDWSIGLLYQAVSDLPKPHWRENQDEDGYANLAVNILPEIAFDLMALEKQLGIRRISEFDVQIIMDSEYVDIDSWLTDYLHNRRSLLSTDTAKIIINNRSNHLESLVAHMADRARSYALLGAISVFHNFREEASRCVWNSANNLIGHYYHKDMLLDSVLNVISSCQIAYEKAELDPTRLAARAKLTSLAPAIAEILVFTDGDETSHLSTEFGEALYHVDTMLFLRYLQWLRKTGEYDDELDLIQYHLRNSELHEPVEQALAATAVDDYSLSILFEKFDSNIPLKNSFLNRFNYLGDGVLRDARQSINERYTSEREDDKNPPSIEEYPPGAFDNFLDELDKRHIIFGEDKCILDWVNHWKLVEKEKVYLDLVNASTNARRVRSIADLIYDLSIDLYGPQESFKWLASAHQENFGWSRFYTTKDHAIRRWQIVKDRYPERWHEFIIATFEGSQHDVLRLVEYCIFLGQLDLAALMQDKFTELALELLSPLHLALPLWINKDNDY